MTQCPKCGYLGFEPADRCRNCSHDFTLAGTYAASEPSLADLDRAIDAVDVEPMPAAIEARADLFDAGNLDALLKRAESGGVMPAPPPAAPTPAPADATFAWPEPVADVQAGGTASADVAGLDVPAVPVPVDPGVGLAEAAAAWMASESLPVAETPAVPVAPAVPASPSEWVPRPTRDLADLDTEDAPLVRLQRPRAPVAVRKTPMSPKLRAVSRPVPQETTLNFLDAAEEPTEAPAPAADDAPPWGHLEASPAHRRLAALVIDGAIFVGLDLTVWYFTLRIAGLTPSEWQVVPLWPLVGFLLGMKIAYATVFTAFGGQTIGKMAAGIRVVSVDDRALSGGAAFRRALASVAAVLTAGLGYLPGLVGERRALHDRASGSRVVVLPLAS